MLGQPRRPASAKSYARRPLTASKPSSLRNYSHLGRLWDRTCADAAHELPPAAGNDDETLKNIEFLVCAQQLDTSVRNRLPGGCCGDDLHLNVLQRRANQCELEVTRKLALLLEGEQRRALAERARIARPLLEHGLKRALSWMRLVCVVRPIIAMTDRLRMQQAQSTLTSLFSTQLFRFLRRRRKRLERLRWIESQLPSMLLPSPDELAKSLPFLKHFSSAAIAELMGQLKPHCSPRGDYISFSMHELPYRRRGGTTGIAAHHAPTEHLLRSNDDTDEPDDLGATHGSGPTSDGSAEDTDGRPLQPHETIFFISSGTVNVYFRFHAPGGGVGGGGAKRHQLVERYSDSGAMGMDALLATRSRRFVAVCKSDVRAWVLPAKVVLALLKKCSSCAQLLFRNVVEDRRREMMRLQPLTVQQCRDASPFFNEWSAAGLARVIAALEPVIVHQGCECSKGVFIVVQGRLEVLMRVSKGMFSGRASVQRTSVVAEIVRPGRAFGELLCYTPENRRMRVRAAVDTDAWFLSRADLLELAAHENVTVLLPLLERAYSRAQLSVPEATAPRHTAAPARVNLRSEPSHRGQYRSATQ